MIGDVKTMYGVLCHPVLMPCLPGHLPTSVEQEFLLYLLMYSIAHTEIKITIRRKHLFSLCSACPPPSEFRHE